MLDECCKIMNLAIAKPVRESLWRGLSNEARYEAKPIVDTIANRWGGGSAAFLVSFVDKTLSLLKNSHSTQTTTHLGGNNNNNNSSTNHNNNNMTILGFPPTLFLCIIIAIWWAVVSADLGQIRKRIDQ